MSKLACKQAVKRAGEKWKKLLENIHSLDNHLKELSSRLEERHQKMTLLMQPLDDEADQNGKEFFMISGKQEVTGNMKKSELERQIALSGYIIEGISRGRG